MQEPSSFPSRGPRCCPATGQGVQSCRGRRTGQRSNRGFPGTWEILPSPPALSVVGGAEPEVPPAHRRCVLGWWERNKAHRVVPPSEGNEARREGRQGVVAP